MFSILLFIIGGIFGSFYNVCIYRLPNDLDIVSKNSFCINCKYKIPFYLNIPIVSYISNLGKCRNCKNKISISYLIVELFTAVLFVYSYKLYLKLFFLLSQLLLQGLELGQLKIYHKELEH